MSSTSATHSCIVSITNHTTDPTSLRHPYRSGTTPALTSARRMCALTYLSDQFPLECFPRQSTDASGVRPECCTSGGANRIQRRNNVPAYDSNNNIASQYRQRPLGTTPFVSTAARIATRIGKHCLLVCAAAALLTACASRPPA